LTARNLTIAINLFHASWQNCCFRTRLATQLFSRFIKSSPSRKVLEGMADVIKKNRQNKYLKKCKLVTVPRTSLGLHNADGCEEKLVPSKADTPALIHFLVQFSSNICQHLKQIFIHIPSLDVHTT
jgi:hypothetical protein